MHRCLGIVEVQRAIFREVYQQPASEDRATLARLSRTCRAFNGSALDVLWATLESFTDLVRCLPRDLWRIDVAEKKLCLCRPMSLKDWEIFYKYSIRVRCVLSSVEPERFTGCTNLGDDVIFALSNPPTYKPLIPCLRELHWDKPNKKYASLLRSLLTPSLDKLSLKTFDYLLRSPEVSILTSVGAVCPSLRTLRIFSFSQFLDTQGEKIFSEAVLCLHSLESLACPALDEAAIVHLSCLPLLSELSMKLRPDFKLNNLTSLAPPAFGSIDSLMLTATSLTTLTSFLEPMQITPSRVSFAIVEAPTMADSKPVGGCVRATF